MDYSNNGYFQYHNQNQFPPYFVQPQFQTLDSQLRDADNRHRHGLTYLTPSPSNMFPSQTRFSGISYRPKFHGESMRAMDESGHWRRTAVRHPAEVTREDGVSVTPDVIIEILVRLPAKFILRFRLVCKFWHALTQEGYFIKRHLEHTPNTDDLGIVGDYFSLASYQPKLFIHYYVNGFHEFDITDLFKHNLQLQCTMSSPCDGLVCVYESRTICVVNPSIREVLVLPKPEHRVVHSVAFGKSMCTGEYKVVRVFGRRDQSMGCEIFSLGSHSWRIIQDPPALILFHDVLPQVVNGTIYWTTDLRAKPKLLVSFDTEKETFDVIMQPVGFSRNSHTMLSVLDGRLCLTAAPAALSQYSVSGEWKKFKKMWVLQGKDSEGNITWKEHHISMRQIESFQIIFWMRPVAMIRGDRKKILWESIEGTFFYYDVTSGRFTSTMRGHNYYPAYPYYRESLVSPIAIQEKNSAPVGIVLKRESRGLWGQRLSFCYKRTGPEGKWNPQHGLNM